jgi:hypothetical protein
LLTGVISSSAKNPVLQGGVVATAVIVDKEYGIKWLIMNR